MHFLLISDFTQSCLSLRSVFFLFVRFIVTYIVVRSLFCCPLWFITEASQKKEARWPLRPSNTGNAEDGRVFAYSDGQFGGNHKITSTVGMI